jgi:hypothetical protein
MNYYKQTGSIWDTFYALDEDNQRLAAIEVRYTSSDRSQLDCYIINNYSAERSNYDTNAVRAIKKYESTTKTEWNSIKSDITAYLKKLESA